MDKDGIDASLGLTFSLELFKRYKQSGMLQAELPRLPGVRGRGKAFLQLMNGEVVSVSLEDKQGQHYSSDKETLCRLDREKGPFEWTLILQSPASVEQSRLNNPFAPGQQPFPESPQPFVSSSPVPRVIAVLTWERLGSWAPQQKDALYTVLTMVNGERTIEEIKSTAPFAGELVDELLRILIELKVITISTL